MPNAAAATSGVAVRIEANDVAWLTLDNPRKLNAMSAPMWRALGDALTRFESDPGVRCCVLSGQGDQAFCVGADISQSPAISFRPKKCCVSDCSMKCWHPMRWCNA